ncbi:MAG: thioredoxin family protein [Candidatus Lokiarchaeota archaeon]|nr:thioredoxin family protein [Candidatus Lokiarchaeota archaeon]
MAKVIIKSFSYGDPVSYIEHIDTPAHQVKFTEKLTTSRIMPETAQRLGKAIRDRGLKLLVFSASWCKDCQEVVPTLAKICQVTSIPMKILGGAKLSQKKPPTWHVPPSPPEMNELDIESLPAILFIDKNGTDVLRHYERAPAGKSLEQHLLDLLEAKVPLRPEP